MSTLHAKVLFVASFRWRVEQADAPVQSFFDVPVLSVIRARGAVSPPVDVVVDDAPPFCGRILPSFRPIRQRSRARLLESIQCIGQKVNQIARKAAGRAESLAQERAGHTVDESSG